MIKKNVLGCEGLGLIVKADHFVSLISLPQQHRRLCGFMNSFFLKPNIHLPRLRFPGPLGSPRSAVRGARSCTGCRWRDKEAGHLAISTCLDWKQPCVKAAALRRQPLLSSATGGRRCWNLISRLWPEDLSPSAEGCSVPSSQLWRVIAAEIVARCCWSCPCGSERLPTGEEVAELSCNTSIKKD